MSVIQNQAARVQVGDGANADSFSITTSAADIELPAEMRGKFVEMYASAGTVYLSLNTTATVANGLEVIAGTPRRIFIPPARDNQFPYTLSAIGSGAATLKVVIASS